MNYLQNFLGIKECNIVPKLGSKKFRYFSRRRDYFSMRLFFYSFYPDQFSFLYDLDNDFLKGRYLFSDKLKRLFRIDFKKNQKLSRVIRPFNSPLFKIRKTRFFIITAASWRKKLRRLNFWKLSSKFNQNVNFNLYKNLGHIYNPYFLQFNFLSSINSVMNVVSENKEVCRFSFVKKKNLNRRIVIRRFRFFRKFNKKSR